MDAQYGIAVNNKFELFFNDEELDPLEVLRQQEEAKKKKDEKKNTKQKDSKSTKNKKNKSLITSAKDEKPKISEDKENRKDGTYVEK